MKVLLAGASGVIGSALIRSLRTEGGHEVRQLVRRAPSSPAEIEWHPERVELDPAVLEGIDVAVCLSGAGVGDHRWTDEYKQTIRSSRTEPVSTLARALAGRPTPLICASAVGYYGETGDRLTDESGPNGEGFLAGVCLEWEAAADAARLAGTPVSHLRTGLVLGGGGLIGRLAPIFKLGGGGRLGSGNQYMPWISLTDEVRAIRFLIDHPEVVGPVNLTGPAPVTNREFTHVMASVLHRPALVAVPRFALRLVLGEFADDALRGQRAVPTKLLDAGFEFTHPDVDSALRAALTP
jgi:uncharacterized protein (TIGR01777 family)